MPVSENTQQAVEWIIGFHPQPPWTVVYIDPARETLRPPAKHFFDRDELANYIEPRNGLVNLYFIPNRTHDKIDTTPRKEDITAITSLYVDLDLPKKGPYTEPTEANFARLLEKIQAIEPRPTSIVYSGGGFQAFWIFPEPLGIEHTDTVEAAGKRIALQLRSDAVQNVNRLMRLPGTWNIPNAKKLDRGRVKALARCVDNDSSRTFDFLNSPLPSLPDGEEPFDPEEIKVVDREEVGPLSTLPAKWQKLIKTGDASEYGGDNSRATAAFITYALRRKWSKEQIKPYLIDEEYGISKHCRKHPNPVSTADRQIERLAEKVKADWEYTGRGSLDSTSPHNIRLAFDKLGITFSFNAFSGRTYINEQHEWSDTQEAKLRVQIRDEYGFTPQRDTMQDVVTALSQESSYHPVINYLETLKWDGEPRIETWLIRHADAPNTPFVRAISRLILIAACRRVRDPGCEFHEMLVLISPKQGTGKSSAIRSLAKDTGWFTDSLPLRISEQKTIEQLQGKWLVECAELAGIHGSDVESLNVLLSRNTDRARMAYGRTPLSVPRQCVFFGTTNLEEFLRGRENRRFWPVRVSNDKINVPGIYAERDQLWAEASELEQQGVSIRLPPELWPDAATAQDGARFGDPWLNMFRAVLGDMEGKLTYDTAWRIIDKPLHFRQPHENGRISECLYELGFIRKPMGLPGQVKTVRAFRRGTETREIKVIKEASGKITACYPDDEIFLEYERFGLSRNEEF